MTNNQLASNLKLPSQVERYGPYFCALHTARIRTVSFDLGYSQGECVYFPVQLYLTYDLIDWLFLRLPTKFLTACQICWISIIYSYRL
jgi:hypothetical protein